MHHSCGSGAKAYILQVKARPTKANQLSCCCSKLHTSRYTTAYSQKTTESDAPQGLLVRRKLAHPRLRP